jgi:uncharacterized membrane protein YccC
LRVADWLPSLVNAGRAFVAIGIVELFWIVTEWPNGALAITFTAIVVLLLAPQGDRAYAAAMRFMIGSVLGTVFTAIIAFAVLPGLETFESLYLIPIGALMAQSWQTVMFTAMVINFVPLLAPTNEMIYNTLQFYNAALAVVTGSGAAAVSFRLLPPLPPAFRARRLLSPCLICAASQGVASHDARRLGGPYVRPARGFARRGRAVAALPARGGVSGGHRNHPTSPHRPPARFGRGPRRGVRGFGARKQRDRDHTACAT